MAGPGPTAHSGDGLPHLVTVSKAAPEKQGSQGVDWTSWGGGLKELTGRHGDGVAGGACGPQVQRWGHHACSHQPGVQSFKVTVLCPPCGAGILLSSGISNICVSPASTATSVQAWAGERCGQALNPHLRCPKGVTAGVHQQATVPSLLRSLLSYTHTFDPELL